MIPKISFITNAYLKKEINIGPNEHNVSTTLFNNFFIKYSEEFLNQYWDNHSSNYGYDYEIGDNYNDRVIPEIANEIFSEFISDKYKRFDTKTSRRALNDASIIALAAVKKAKKIIGFVDDLTFEEIMILRTAGFLIQWYLRNKYLEVNIDIYNDANSLMLNINNSTYAIYTLSWLVDAERYDKSFVSARMVRVNNLPANAAIWSILSISLLGVTGILHTRKYFK